MMSDHLIEIILNVKSLYAFMRKNLSDANSKEI